MKYLIDFDGTISTYKKWNGYAVTGEPIPFAKECITKLFKDGHEIIIFSVRAGTKEGKDAIIKFMDINNIPYHCITNIKCRGVIIDDNCYRFEGWDNIFLREITSSK